MIMDDQINNTVYKNRITNNLLDEKYVDPQLHVCAQKYTEYIRNDSQNRN